MRGRIVVVNISYLFSVLSSVRPSVLKIMRLASGDAGRAAGGLLTFEKHRASRRNLRSGDATRRAYRPTSPVENSSHHVLIIHTVLLPSPKIVAIISALLPSCVFRPASSTKRSSSLSLPCRSSFNQWFRN